MAIFSVAAGRTLNGEGNTVGLAGATGRVDPLSMQIFDRSAMRLALIFIGSFRKPSLQGIEVERVEFNGI